MNLGNPDEFTIARLAREVVALVGADVPVVHRPLPADDRQRRPNIARAREVLGFEPRVPLRKGLALTLRDFRERLDLAPTNGASNGASNGANSGANGVAGDGAAHLPPERTSVA